MDGCIFCLLLRKTKQTNKKKNKNMYELVSLPTVIFPVPRTGPHP